MKKMRLMVKLKLLNKLLDTNTQKIKNIKIFAFKIEKFHFKTIY